MSDASTSEPQPEPQNGIESALMRRYQAQTDAALAQTDLANARGDFWRRLAKWAIGVLALVGAGFVALAVVLVMIANSTHHDGAITRQKADAVLSLAQGVTSPKAQQAQRAAFFGAETAIFRADCVAKAHQLATINNNLGGTVTEPQLEAECARIQPPAMP